jgi:hypothetical protein
MNQAAALSSQKPRAMPAILWGGFACGALDITAALVVYGYFGLKPVRLLQGIAAGLLGARAFDGGFATASSACFAISLSRFRPLQSISH